MTVHHLLEAELELLEAVSFYKARAGDLAVNFYSEFKRAREEIAAFPDFWGSVGGGYRAFPTSRTSVECIRRFVRGAVRGRSVRG